MQVMEIGAPFAVTDKIAGKRTITFTCVNGLAVYEIVSLSISDNSAIVSFVSGWSTEAPETAIPPEWSTGEQHGHL